MKKSFLISLLGLAALLILGLVKGIDTSMALASVVLAYTGSRASQKIGLGMAVSRDVNANSENVVDKLKD